MMTSREIAYANLSPEHLHLAIDVFEKQVRRDQIENDAEIAMGWQKVDSKAYLISRDIMAQLDEKKEGKP